MSYPVQIILVAELLGAWATVGLFLTILTFVGLDFVLSDLEKSWSLLPRATCKSPAFCRSPKYGRWRHFLRKGVLLSVIESQFEYLKEGKDQIIRMFTP